MSISDGVLNVFNIQALLNSRLHSSVWIVGEGNDFSFLLFSFLDGLQFLKHVAFEEGITNQRGLRLLWSNSKGFPYLTTTAQCLHKRQNTKQAWPPTFLLSLYNPHLSPDCHTAMLSTQPWSIVTWKEQSHWSMGLLIRYVKAPTWRSAEINLQIITRKKKTDSNISNVKCWGVTSLRFCSHEQSWPLT